MKPILYIKGSDIGDVRLRKFIKYFIAHNSFVKFWGWDRTKENKQIAGSQTTYLLSGGTSTLILHYCIWMFLLFFKILFLKDIKKNNIIAINFDAAFPVYIASKFRRFNYFYEIYDEFALSYNFPSWLKKIITELDHKIIDNADVVIHVDSNRINYKGKYGDKTIVVIENTPNDYFMGQERSYEKITNTFVVSGRMNRSRGLDQILTFIKTNQDINLICIGEIRDKILKNELLKLNNVSLFPFMPQEEAFKLMENCCAIFSLYNPNLEINKLAASNKVYDAMMLGIPIITNKDVMNASYIKANNIGYIIDYEYNDSWNVLISPNFIHKSIELGKNGRKLYEQKFQLNSLIEKNLLPLLR